MLGFSLFVANYGFLPPLFLLHHGSVFRAVNGTCNARWHFTAKVTDRAAGLLDLRGVPSLVFAALQSVLHRRSRVGRPFVPRKVSQYLNPQRQLSMAQL